MTQPVDVRDDAWFCAVYEDQFASLVRLAFVTTGGTASAEDLVQDVFADLYRRRAQVSDPAAWLRRATVNRCTSWVRRRVLERKHARPEPVTVEVPLGPDAVAVRKALAQLRPRHRAAVFLRYYLDLSDADIAAAMQCRPGTVKSLLHRGLNVMKEHLR
ncbi:RNA polymerase sigma factor [Catelliglobosispora koreensis]|uniref:RNA polymerase sigma factor n=1 Tax=Catelliglobosispora koreensis TaxID=129052 RepID=UPI0003615C44|nr:sigma-70 family RNA polymerase sigma factor [Catelliglobosispora koreensis]